MILGLTGSIGSGKSFVSKRLEELGARIICADSIAREVVAPGSPALNEIVEAFGPQVLQEDGSLDRRRVAEAVFNNEEQRKQLEAIIHPRVREREENLLRQYQDSLLTVLEVPLLFETGAEKLCDAVAVVTLTDEIRFERLAEHRGMTKKQAQERLATQMPESEKASKADYLIDNSGSKENTIAHVDRLFRTLTSGAHQTPH